MLSAASSSSPASISSTAGPASPAKRLGELPPPGVLAGRGPLVRRDQWARHVGEPHDVAGRRSLVAEEGLPPEDQVPGLRLDVRRRATRDAAEVRQADVAARRGRGIDDPADHGVHAVGPDEQVAAKRCCRRRTWRARDRPQPPRPCSAADRIRSGSRAGSPRPGARAPAAIASSCAPPGCPAATSRGAATPAGARPRSTGRCAASGSRRQSRGRARRSRASPSRPFAVTVK